MDVAAEAKAVLNKTLPALILASLWGIFAFGSATAAPEGARWGADYFPNLTVITQDGKKLRFYDDLIKNKKVIVNFIYTECPDICSLSTARLAAVQDRLGDLVGKEFFFYSISLDPKTDTPKKLKQFASSFAAGPGWMFLTGAPKDLHLIRYKLGERSQILSDHRNTIMLGNDQTGEWGKSSTMANLQLLESNIRELDPKWFTRRRKPGRKLPQAKSYVIGNQPGEALFLKACASCHKFGRGDYIGPDLNGVHQRRDREWLIRFLMDPDALRARKDPIAIALDKRFPGVVMPNLSLSRTDAKDLLHYFKMRSEKVSAGSPPDHHQHAHAADNNNRTHHQ